jgi:hypothetical protein
LPRFRVNVTFAPAGGRRLYHGETVDIDDANLEPYGAFVTKRWLVPVDVPADPLTMSFADDESTVGHVWKPGDDELAVIDVGDPDADLPDAETET